jgi:hypothetical protein
MLCTVSSKNFLNVFELIVTEFHRERRLKNRTSRERVRRCRRGGELRQSV